MQGLGEPHAQLGLPDEQPFLAKRPAPRRGFRLPAPRDGDQQEAVQQRRLQQARLAAQVDGKLLFVGRRLQPQAPLPAFEIGKQRHARDRFVDLADLCADDEPALDEAQKRRFPMTEHRERSFLHFRQAGHGEAAHRGKACGEPRRFDDRSGARRKALAAQQAGDARLPARRHLADVDSVRRSRPPQVPIPAGRDHAGAVARNRRQPRIGPGHPGRRRLDAGESLQRLAILRDRHGREQRRHMPGAADDRDRAVRLAQRFADAQAHMRLAPLLPVRSDDGRP